MREKPVLQSHFIGREADARRTEELFAGGARVVTLLGPAGIGKTSLALRYAETSARSVCFVALAEARSENALVAAVAAALGDSTGDVGHAIEGRGELLLVLDNVEQVVTAAALAVARWVSTAPHARFLVTSRERLRLESEACLELSPLGDDDAARLFALRAALARGRFDPTEEDLRAIRELTARLDGNPLAIELAAARTKLFSPVDLNERLQASGRFDLLRGGPRDRSARQSSLRGAIDWSWELLDSTERRALARCSVFRGGFSLEAATAVLAPSDALQLVESLVDKSLVRHSGRFGLYETIREYAEARSQELGETDEAAALHAEYFFERAEAWSAELRGEHAVRAATNLRADTDNVLAAHRHLHRRDPTKAARIALALDSLLAMRGPIEMERELLDSAVVDAELAGAELCVRALVARCRARSLRGDSAGAETDVEKALALAVTAGDGARAMALEASARLDVDRGRADRARERIEEALVLHRKAKSEKGEASSLSLSAAIYIKQGRIDDARETFERAIARARELGDRAATMSLLANMGITHHWQGRDVEAKACYRAALELAVSLGDRREESVDRTNLALLLVDEGAIAEAQAEFERVLTIQRETGHRQYIGNTIGSLGSVELLHGDLAAARKRFEESLVIFRELGNRRYEAATHRYLGTLSLEEGDLPGALASLEDAQRAADAAGDFVSFVAGPLGATLALLGRMPEAEEAFARAHRSLEKRGEPRAFVLLEIFEAFLTLARGDLATAKKVVDVHRAAPLASDARVALRMLEANILRRATPTAQKLTLGPEARWFRVGEREKIDLSKRRAPRLILLALSQASQPLSLDDIVAAGWPGERIRPDAAAARAYTAIKQLRELGLGALLVRRDDGYLLDSGES